MNQYIVATIRSWNIAQYHASLHRMPGQWHLIVSGEALSIQRLREISPRFIFFPHWSEKVPTEIIDEFECVCFHETDVPYGRGGSPIQNLIERGHTETVISALRMVEKFDSGPVYAKRPMSLLGLGEEIYLRAAHIVFEMIREIVLAEPDPIPQIGEPTFFRRRTPDQSRLPSTATSLSQLFDHIRMLDADGYPRSFLEYGEFRIEFTRPALRTEGVEAQVCITPINGEKGIS